MFSMFKPRDPRIGVVTQSLQAEVDAQKTTSSLPTPVKITRGPFSTNAVNLYDKVNHTAEKREVVRAANAAATTQPIQIPALPDITDRPVC